jgi:hypothetical protein
VYEAFQGVHFLQGHHRCHLTSPLARELLRLVNDCLQNPSVTQAQMEMLCDELQQRAISSLADFIPRNPCVLVLRNSVRTSLNYHIASLTAASSASSACISGWPPTTSLPRQLACPPQTCASVWLLHLPMMQPAALPPVMLVLF